MSRPWSRFGIRAVAVLLLLVGVAGGVYLGDNRKAQQVEIDATAVSRADQAEQQLMKTHAREQSVALADKRAAEQVAASKAAQTARAAAELARRADEAASRRRAESRAVPSPTPTPTPTRPPSFGPIPASCNEYSGNRGIGCALLLEAGFRLAEMVCLEKLWTRESGWNATAGNPTSGAYGIPQALPGNKMAEFGDDWRTNPATQIEWGLSYIRGRYDTPCGAWQHFQDVGWY